MISKELRNAFKAVTTKLEDIMNDDKLRNFIEYCGQVVEGFEDVDVPLEDIKDLETLKEISDIALEQMLNEAERMDLTDEELLTAMIVMISKENATSE